MTNKSYKWNAVPAATIPAGMDYGVRSFDPQGVICGKTLPYPIASGLVLKAGTLLTRNGAQFSPLPSKSETRKLVFDADITGTAAKKVVWTIAGLTITSATNVLHLSDLFDLLAGAEAGTTGADLLAVYTGSGFTSVAGTLTGYHILADEANRVFLFVSTAFQVDPADLTFTLVDTASSPVDLSSHVTATTGVIFDDVTGTLINPPVQGILAIDVDTTSGVKSAAVYEDAEIYSTFLNLAQEPAIDNVAGVRTTLYCSGIYTFQQLTMVLSGSKFSVLDAGTATV